MKRLLPLLRKTTSEMPRRDSRLTSISTPFLYSTRVLLPTHNKYPLSLHNSLNLHPTPLVQSDTHTPSMPTTVVQNIAPSSSVARVAACAQRPTPSEQTPRKSMKMRVTMSGVGQDGHLRWLFVRRLWDEAQGDIFIAQVELVAIICVAMWTHIIQSPERF